MQLGPEDLKRASILAEGWRSLQERRAGHSRDERANLGETTTIVAAEKHGWAVILDEGKARTYAQRRGLTVFSTQDLVVEMAAAGELKDRRALLVYRRVYSDATAAAFEQALQAARAALRV